jgi:hypothetical protein
MASGGRAIWAGAALALLVAGQAAAQDSGLRDICPDRPTKGTAPCTVDQGHLQLEADFFAGSWNRDGGISEHDFTYANPTLKYGLTDSFDIEVNLPPMQTVRVHDDATGETDSHSGIGDLTLRAKWSLTANRDKGWNFAIEPFLKAPVAHAPIGNGAWEGGLLVPFAGNLNDKWSIDITPELDVVEDGAGGGRHTALAGSVGLTRAMGAGVSLTGELWTATDFDPLGTTQQYSADFAVAWTPFGRKDLQLDTGVNLGLNRQTDDVEAYVGIARRF